MIRELEYLSDANPFARYLEYMIDDKKVGYLKYSLIYDRMEVDDFFVEEEYRNQGIGNKLMSYLIVKAIEARVVNITLEVRLSNEIARNLYKKYGFRIVSVRKGYYDGVDGYLMVIDRK